MEIQTMAVNNLDHNTTHDLTSPLLCNFQALDFKLCSSTHPNPNSSPPSPQPMGVSLQKFGITSIEPNLDVDEEKFSDSLLHRQDGVDIERVAGSEYRADSAIVAKEDVEGGAGEEQELKITSPDQQDGIDMERFACSAIVEQKVASLDREDGIDIERFRGSEYIADSAIVEMKIASVDRQDGVDIERFAGSGYRVDSAIVEQKNASVDRQDGMDIERFAGSEYRADSAIVVKEDVEGAADEEHELKITLPDRQVGIDIEPSRGSEYRADSAIFEQKIASVDRQDGVDIERFAGSEYRADSTIVANKDIEGTSAEEHDLKIASIDRQDGVDTEPFCGSENRADSAIFEQKIASVERFAGSENRADSAIVELKNASLDRQDGVDIEHFAGSEYRADSAIVEDAGVEEQELKIASLDVAEELNSTSPDQQNGINIEPFTGSEYKAAIKLQKFYKSYRTRRRLADSAIVAEELWWQARDFARLNHTTVSFFNYSKPETAISRWNRVSINASKVGQGLSKDGKALKLAFQHWIEAIDPRHRYGHNLHFYYEKWCESKTDQPFFYWLDLGEGKNLDLEECPRSLLRQQCIKYLGPHERERYEYVLVESRIRHKQTGDLLDTTKGPEGAKWIFVMSTSRRLYAGRKERGRFQHSSFLAGGTTIAAGRLTAENGVLKAIWAYSGHYKPTTDNLKQFIDYLRENGADLNLVQIRASGKEDYNEDDPENPQSQTGKSLDSAASVLKPPPLRIPSVNFAPLDKPIESSVDNKSEVMGGVYRRTFSGGLQSPVAGVPEKAISERIKSKRESGSYQLGHQVSSKWCSGVGPRIGCIADYPVELRLQALEFTNLSPRTTPTQSFCSSSVLSPLSQVIS